MTTAAMPDERDQMVSSPPAADAPGDDRLVIDTRFGPMEFAKDQSIEMPRGVLGFAEHRNFGLAYLPNKFIDQLMLLQSLTDPDTSFLVLPLNIDAGIIDEADLVSACQTMNIDPDQAAVVVIVTIRDVAGNPQITVNLRAPIILNSVTQTGWQYVLPNGKYSVRHTLTAGSAPTPPTGG